MKTFTVDDIMELKLCYSRDRVERLWSGRTSLTYEQIMKLDIPNGDIIWFLEQSGFTGMFEDSDGTKFWYKAGKCHREDGPAIEYLNGSKEWRVNGQLHRQDGPAAEHSDGTKEWWVDGKYHRDGGLPAVEWVDGEFIRSES